MTDGLSTVNVANAWLNTFLATSCSFSGVYVQLHTASPGANGTTAVSAGTATRIHAGFATATGGVLALSSAMGPWTNAGFNETLTDVSLWTAASGGTFLVSLPLTVTKPWASGDTFTLNTLTIQIVPLAA